MAGDEGDSRGGGGSWDEEGSGNGIGEGDGDGNGDDGGDAGRRDDVGRVECGGVFGQEITLSVD